MHIRAHVLVEATTVLERGGFGAGRVCISWFSRPTTLAPRVASRRLHHTVEHYITENDEPRVQSPGTLASLMCVMPLPRGECTAPATIYIPRNSRNRSHFVVPLSIRARSPLPSFSLVRPIAFVRVRTRIVVNIRGMEENERFCISARPRKQGSHDWRSISRGRLELIQTFFSSRETIARVHGIDIFETFHHHGRIENYGIDTVRSANCVINGVIEIAELGWALELFYERHAAVTGKKLVYNWLYIYEFRWNSNYERGTENMWRGGEYVGTRARIEREFLLRFLRCRNQNQSSSN